MGTRSTTIVRSGDKQQMAYRQFDSYPSGLGKSLKRYLNRIKGWNFEKILKKLAKGVRDWEDKGYVYTFALTDEVHVCAWYVYIIDCDRQELLCYEREVGESLEQCCIPSRLRAIR